MKTQNQIKIIKIIYVLTLSAGFVIAMLNSGIQGFKDSWNGADNKVFTNNPFSFFYGFLLLIICFFALRILIYLYRFILSVELGDVFSDINIRRLSLIGWYCILMPFLLFLFNFSKLVNLSFSSLTKIDFEFWLLILGLALLVVSFVFKKGIELKQENDLTI